MGIQGGQKMYAKITTATYATLIMLLVAQQEPINNISEYSLSRSVLTSDDNDNDFFVIWHNNPTKIHAPLQKEIMIKNTQTNTYYALERLWLRRPSQYESWYWQMLKLKKGTPLGKYELLTDNKIIGTIQITANVYKSKINIQVPTGTSVSIINAYLARGYNVTLMPGEYIVTPTTGPILMQPNSELKGHNVIITGKSHTYRHALISLQDNCKISGLTFKSEYYKGDFDFCGAFNGAVNNTVNNASIIDCTFLVGDFGIFSHPGILVHRCTFKLTGANRVNSGLWLNNTFEGIGPLEHAFEINGATNLAILETSMRETDRGLIIRGAKSCLFAGLTATNISKINNGSELACIEGGLPVNNNSFFGWRADNCVAGFSPFDAEFCNNLIYDMRINGPTWAFSFFGINKQTDNIIAESHSDGGGVFFNHPPTKDANGTIINMNNGARNNVIKDCGFVNWRLTPGNQSSGRTYYYTRPDLPNMAVITDFSSIPYNKCEGVTVKSQPADRQQFYNIPNVR